MTAAGRTVACVISSSRVKAMRTGRPAMRASRAASIAIGYGLLLPKPPPTSGVITRTCDSSISKRCASSVRMPNGRCVPAQTVRWSPSHFATAARGSIGAFETYGM